jgi:hypothetical protein
VIFTHSIRTEVPTTAGTIFTEKALVHDISVILTGQVRITVAVVMVEVITVEVVTAAVVTVEVVTVEVVTAEAVTSNGRCHFLGSVVDSKKARKIISKVRVCPQVPIPYYPS